MTGIELFAERKRRHRRTWTVAAIVLGLIFMIGGQLGAYLPAIAAGFITPGGGTDGWPQLTYELVAAFGLGCALVAGIWGGLLYGHFLQGVWPFLTTGPDGAKGGLPLGSIFLFDLGVYLVVFGTLCGILFALEEAVASDADTGGD